MATMNQESNQSKQDTARSAMESFVKDGYKIFIDTCSLLDDHVDEFWRNIIPLLHQYSSKIIIPWRCGQELEKHVNNKSDPDLAKM